MKLLIGYLCALATGLAAGAELHPLLEKLRADLLEARGLPVGAETSYRCPTDLQRLKGIKLVTITSAFPKPDFQTATSAVYFLTSPVPFGQMGGGFPQIAFIAGKSGVVEDITCYYAR